MISIKTYNDLFSRPILEALIEKQTLKSGFNTSGQERLKGGEERSTHTTRGRGENHKVSDENYIFDLPSVHLSRTEGGRELLELAGDEQDVQYIMAQMVLSNLGLIPKVNKGRNVNVNPSNAKKINKIKNLLENLFATVKLDDNAPASILKNLLTYTKIDIDNEVGFNTFDLLNRKLNWEDVLKNLPKNIAGYIAGHFNREELQKQTSKRFYSNLSGEKDNDMPQPKSVAAFASKMGSQKEEDAEEDNDISFAAVVTEADKEKIFSKALNLLKPLYTLASQSGMTPAQYLTFQSELSKAAGALKGHDIQKNLAEVEAKNYPTTIGDYKDTLIEAVAKSIKGDDKKMQVSNLIAKQANRSLRKLKIHLDNLGYKGGLKIANVLDYIKNGDDKEATDSRYYLETIYGIKPEELTTENFPNFKTFVHKLYTSDQNILKSYKTIKPRQAPAERINMKRTHLKDGTPVPMVADHKGGVVNAAKKITGSLAKAEKSYEEGYFGLEEAYEKAKIRDKEWRENTLKLYTAIGAGKLGLGKIKEDGKRDERDQTPVIDFGEVTLKELKEKVNKGVSNGWIDYVTPNFKDIYTKAMEENPAEKIKEIKSYIEKQKYMAPNKAANALRHKLGKSKDAKTRIPGTGENVVKRYTDKIDKFKNQLSAVTGKPITPILGTDEVPIRNLADLQGEDPDDVTGNPHIIYTIDDTSPRLINPILATFKKELEPLGIVIEWETNLEDEDEEEIGYLTLYYPEDSKIYRSKNPKKMVEDLRNSIRKLAVKLGYDYIDIKTYSYEFKNAIYDPSGLTTSNDEDEEFNIDSGEENADIESEFDSEEEEFKVKEKLNEQKIKYVLNSVKHPNQYNKDRIYERYIEQNI